MTQPITTGKTTYDLRNFSILLAEDYDFMQGLIVSMLKAYGVGNIVQARNVDEARDLITISSASSGTTAGIKGIDLVLTDWLMPGGSGKMLIKWARDHKQDNIKFMPFIVVSAFASAHMVAAARDIGANETLVKPVSGDNLASRILNVIDHPRPFIKSPYFFGPDRRRKDRPYPGDDKRKTSAEEINIHNEQL